MRTPFRYRAGQQQPVAWHRATLPGSNQRCLYCGLFLGDGLVNSDKEHLIGREFVPPGSWDGGRAFNFVFRACVECNTRKSRVEAHVSAVTMFDSLTRPADPRVDARAREKAEREVHPETGKAVKDSHSKLSAKFRSGGVSMSFGLTAPPPLRHKWARELAYRHVQGFFSLVTSQDPLALDGTRILTGDEFWFGGIYRHSDWGNPMIAELAERVRTWATPVMLTTAGGHFQAVLRQDDDQWFWALEWNRSVRLVGGISSPNRQPPVFDALTRPLVRTLNKELRYREEIPLKEDNDILFA